MISYRFLLIILVAFVFGCGGGGSSNDNGNTSQNNSTPVPDTSQNDDSVTDGTIRIYVAGESVEEMNRFVNPPFNEDGTLNGGSNSGDEYGWMVPFMERLRLRQPGLDIEWIGAECWLDWTWECSNGTYPFANSMQFTSAISGSTVSDWLAERGDELIRQDFCYDIAFASRGGNDLNRDVSETEYKENLRQLILLLDQGSSCRENPLIYVTAHILDIANGVKPNSEQEVTSWLESQRVYYVEIPQLLIEELSNEFPYLNLRFVDMWTPFYENKSTTAFPNETWWTTVNGVYAPDILKIHREDDYWSGQHPRRLASIFAGENVADQVDLNDLAPYIGSN